MGTVEAHETSCACKRANGGREGHAHKAGDVALGKLAADHARAFADTTAITAEACEILATNATRGATLVTPKERRLSRLPSKGNLRSTKL